MPFRDGRCRAPHHIVASVVDIVASARQYREAEAFAGAIIGGAIASSAYGYNGLPPYDYGYPYSCGPLREIFIATAGSPDWLRP